MLSVFKHFFKSLTLKKPELIIFKYSKIILKGNTYLLLTWHIENANKLRILELKYKCSSYSGSAYILLNPEINSLTFLYKNYWHTYKITLHLHLIPLEEKIEFNLNTNFKEIISSSVQGFGVTLPTNKITINIKQPKHIIENIKIKNLEYN